ncbi:hypothetical protein TPAR_02086 [Tolypocladium paradoxum]|uniref:Uncharacterized protein n=1 Tax=Tolypocladium paradoxum TaxID=94208 RepID=A0A2S4L5M5_9HYPO|nr:hypothetical protein TPAR_02086 [Tolypocladium paradoxum]
MLGIAILLPTELSEEEIRHLVTVDAANAVALPCRQLLADIRDAADVILFCRLVHVGPCFGESLTGQSAQDDVIPPIKLSVVIHIRDAKADRALAVDVVQSNVLPCRIWDEGFLHFDEGLPNAPDRGEGLDIVDFLELARLGQRSRFGRGIGSLGEDIE